MLKIIQAVTINSNSINIKLYTAQYLQKACKVKSKLHKNYTNRLQAPHSRTLLREAIATNTQMSPLMTIMSGQEMKVQVSTQSRRG